MVKTHALSLSPHLGVWGVPLGLWDKGMASSRKVSCIVFVMHVEYLLLHVTCVDPCTCTCGCKCNYAMCSQASTMALASPINIF